MSDVNNEMYEKITQVAYKLCEEEPNKAEDFKKTYSFFNEFPKLLRKKVKALAKNIKQFPIITIFDRQVMSKYFDNVDELCVYDYGYAVFVHSLLRYSVSAHALVGKNNVEVAYIRDAQFYTEICKMRDVFKTLVGADSIFALGNDLTFFHCLSNVIYNNSLCNTTCKITLKASVSETTEAELTVLLQVPDIDSGKKCVQVTIENETMNYSFSFFIPNNLPKFEECVF